jgi:hypothetical protein
VSNRQTAWWSQLTEPVILTITDTQGNVTTTPLHLHQLAYLRGKDLSDVMKFGAMLAFYVSAWSGVEFDNIATVTLA